MLAHTASLQLSTEFGPKKSSIPTHRMKSEATSPDFQIILLAFFKTTATNYQRRNSNYIVHERFLIEKFAEQRRRRLYHQECNNKQTDGARMKSNTLMLQELQLQGLVSLLLRLRLGEGAWKGRGCKRDTPTKSTRCEREIS